LHCLNNGAHHVDFVDISKKNIILLRKNIDLNQITNDKYSIFNMDVFKFLTEKHQSKDFKKYDLIILDPPSFAKNKYQTGGALRGFYTLIEKSFDLLDDKGLLAVFSCSYHITLKDIEDTIRKIGLKKHFYFQVLKIFTQDIDHPIISSFPQSFYLKGLLVKKIF
jgi:23S rRNA (cytosine1962-C5)-methyltransferase